MHEYGKFITFEGGEGAGKSTQIRLLQGYLKRKGVDVVCTREPGGTPGADAIRSLLVTGAPDKWDPWTELLLMTASRQDHVQRVILPSLASGKWVVSDRYFDSSRVYQGIVGGVGLQAVDQLSFELLKFPRPDLTFVLDVPAHVGLGRAVQRLHGPGFKKRESRDGTGDPLCSVTEDGTIDHSKKEDRYENKGMNFHEAVRQGFLQLADHEPQRFRMLDATLSLDVLAQDIATAVEATF